MTEQAEAGKFYTLTTQQMIIPILIAIAVFLLVFGCGAVIWFVLRQRQTIRGKEAVPKTTAAAAPLSFHWSYVILPMLILLLSVALAASLYHRLPVEVAYHFKPDGAPDRWLNRAMIVLGLLLVQLFFTLLAGASTWGIVKLSALFKQPGGTPVKPERILSLMGNMIALPQVIFCFAMLDIFSYNAYRIHLMPLWVFALIIMVLGGVILGVFFIRALRQVWRASQ